MKKRLILCILLMLLLALALPCAGAQEQPLVPALAPAQMQPLDGAEPLPLYCGPTQGFYHQSGAQLDPAALFVLFGQDDCWAMAAQGTVDSFGPVGWVEAAALGLGGDAPALAFEDALPAMIEEDAPVTDNPLAAEPFAGWNAVLPRGTQVIVLASLGDWLYVQCEIEGQPARVFVPASCIL